MKFSKSKALDRLRGTLEGFTKFKFAGTACSVTGLSHGDLVSVDHQQEIQVELQELRNLVLEAISLETTQRTDPAGYREIEFLSRDSIDSASMDTTGDLFDPTIENHCA